MIQIQLPVAHGETLARRAARLVAPQSANQLHSYIRAVLGFNIPRIALAPGHDAPFDYVQHAFFESRQPRDLVIWANRGGGKTQLGAIATLLDLLFKPGIQIRILGGSFDQSSKMHRYLKRLLETDVFNDLIAGNLTGRHVELINGSRVEVLSQSERSVRGQRIHKLRCDEVELFDADIWEAAQLVTRSGRCGSVEVHASIEAFSTMHKPYGLMRKLVQEHGQSIEQRPAPLVPARRIFRWSVVDTLEHCPATRACEACTLWDECQGRAKATHSRGFMRIEDAIQQKRRVGLGAWAAEMLCERPDRSDSVYPEFDERLHVYDDQDASSPARGAGSTHGAENSGHSFWIGGIDFGFRSPTTLLWGWVDREGVLRIVDELVERERISAEFIKLAEVRSLSPGRQRPEWIGADPAGHQRHEHTGISTIALWKRAGWSIRTRRLPIDAGVAAVRARLMRGDRSIGLLIHRRCEKLIEAMMTYRYPAAPQSDRSPSDSGRRGDLRPLKDGADHAADALRYMIVNLDRGSWKLIGREY